MTRTIRGRSSFQPYFASTLLTVIAATVGCSSEKATCSPGNEACPCYGNHTCNGSLTCASDLCVNLSAGGSSSVGGGPSATTATSTPSSSTANPQGGASSTGITSPAGGTVNTGSTMNEGGANVGGATTGILGNGGASAFGGAANTGGENNAGGAIAQGGNSTAAGTQSVGGVAAAGGQSAASGGMPIGGDTAVIGTALGGQNPAGGVSNVAGTAPSVGGSAGGQTAATGGGPPNTCGNGTVEGNEGCDPSPGDNNLGDGCTPLCKVEPNCPVAGGGCTTRCGDGFVLDGEACDDGNTVDGDGCSSTCQIEPDFDCVQLQPGDSIVVPMVVRDFNQGGDFEKAYTGLNYANQGLVKPILNDQGKPELASTTGTYYGLAGEESGIASADSFARWYNDAATNTVNSYHGTLATSLRLYKSANGTYANRYGANGEQWIRESYYADNWCGYVGEEVLDADGKPIPCTFCPGDNLSTPECDYPYALPCDDRTNFLRCDTQGSAYYGIYAEAILDGTPLFFPADALTPFSPSSSAQLPPYYASYWTAETNSPKHNFNFTTEVRFWFKYDASQTLKLSFLGDDDAWIFVNKQLAVDIGGIHTPVKGDLTVNTDGTATAVVTSTDTGTTVKAITNPVTLGLEDGKLYEVAVFQAERQTTASSYMLTFSGFNTAPSACIHK